MFLKATAMSVTLALAITSSLSAQRDPIIGSSFLSTISVATALDDIQLDLIYAQEGGSTSSVGHAQMYIFAYLEKDEKQVLELTQAEALITKLGQEEQLLEVLKSRKLAVMLDAKVTKRSDVGVPGELDKQEPIRYGSLYRFSFEFEKRRLFEDVSSSLANFQGIRKTDGGTEIFWEYEERFKLLVLVPTNDSKYGNLIPDKDRVSDFAHFQKRDRLFKLIHVLPYFFEFGRRVKKLDGRPLENDILSIYIN